MGAGWVEEEARGVGRGAGESRSCARAASGRAGCARGWACCVLGGAVAAASAPSAERRVLACACSANSSSSAAECQVTLPGPLAEPARHEAGGCPGAPQQREAEARRVSSSQNWLSDFRVRVRGWSLPHLEAGPGYPCRSCLCAASQGRRAGCAGRCDLYLPAFWPHARPRAAAADVLRSTPALIASL